MGYSTIFFVDDGQSCDKQFLHISHLKGQRQAYKVTMGIMIPFQLVHQLTDTMEIMFPFQLVHKTDRFPRKTVWTLCHNKQ
jgi:hypothetical protein